MFCVSKLSRRILLIRKLRISAIAGMSILHSCYGSLFLKWEASATLRHKTLTYAKANITPMILPQTSKAKSRLITATHLFLYSAG